jgi:hypothetical protein
MLRARRLVTLWQRQAAGRAVALASSSSSPASALTPATSSTATRLCLQTPARFLSAQAAPPAAGALAADREAGELAAALEACRESGDWRAALKLLDALDQRGRVDARMYEHAVAACARMGKVDVLPGLLQNMQDDGLQPTTASIDFVVQALMAREDWRALVDNVAHAVEQRVPLSPAAFQAAMEACGQVADAQAVLRIMEHIRETDAEHLTTAHYAAAIRAVGMANRVDLAVQLFTSMEEGSAALEADAEVFTQLIRAQIVNRALPQALRTFATADRRGVAAELPESIFTATVDALVKQRDHWQAVRLFEHMLALELRPSAFCLGRAMVAYVRSNKHQLAWAVWRKLEVAADAPVMAAAAEGSAVPPVGAHNLNTLFKFSKLLNELVSSKNAKLAVTVFEWIQARFDLTEVRAPTVAVAIRAYGRDGQTDKAMQLFEDFVASCAASRRPLPRAAAVYVAAFNALSRDAERDPHENTRDAKRVWNLMVENVPVVLPPAYASLAGVFASSGELDTLEQVLMQAGASTSVDDSSQDDEDEVLDGDDDEEEVLADVDIADLDEDVLLANSNDELLFNGVISGFAKARHDQSDHILTYLQLMSSRGLTINDSIVRASTDAFVRHARWPLVTQLAGFLDVDKLQNADVCFGDTISKLLDARAYGAVRHWLKLAHSYGLSPPIRNKMTVLKSLREDVEPLLQPGKPTSKHGTEWRIAYALARETLSFKQLTDAHVDSVADAVDVCAAAGRSDLVFKLYHQLQGAVDVAEELTMPLRVYKRVVLSLLRERDARDADQYEQRVRQAEQICGDMLRVHGKQLDSDALSLAISLKATLGDDDDVRALFETMSVLSLVPNSYAENAAVSAYSRAGQTQGVLAVWNSYANDPARRDVIDKNVLRSLLKSLALANEDDALERTAREFATCSVDDVMQGLLSANRVARAVELADVAQMPDEQYRELLMRVLSDGNRKAAPCDPLLGAALVLKRIRAVGIENVRAGDVLRVVKKLLANEQLVEAEQLLSIYTTSAEGAALRQLKPYHQREVMESLLFVYGEQGRFDKLRALLESNPLAFPLTVQHYEIAMEYGVESAEAGDVGALTTLRMFEALRQHFVKPSGAVYVLALRGCRKLERLTSTGALIVDDCVEQGFVRLLANELTARAELAVRERSSETTTGENEVDAQDLADVALLSRRRGVRLPAKLVTALGELRSELEVDTRNEVAYLVEQHKQQQARKRRSSRARASGEDGAAEVEMSAAGTPGAKWGDLYLQPVVKDDQ